MENIFFCNSLSGLLSYTTFSPDIIMLLLQIYTSCQKVLSLCQMASFYPKVFSPFDKRCT